MEREDKKNPYDFQEVQCLADDDDEMGPCEQAEKQKMTFSVNKVMTYLETSKPKQFIKWLALT